MTKKYLSLSLVVIFFMTACGFHLRGASRRLDTFPPVYLIWQTVDPHFKMTIENQLRSSGLKIVETPQKSAVSILIETAHITQETLASGSTVEVHHYLLKGQLNYQLNKGKTYHFVQAKQYSQNPNQYLGSNLEAQTLKNEIEMILSSQLINQMSRWDPDENYHATNS